MFHKDDNGVEGVIMRGEASKPGVCLFSPLILGGARFSSNIEFNQSRFPRCSPGSMNHFVEAGSKNFDGVGREKGWLW